MSGFVGRNRELERLTRILEGAQAGKGRVLFITGEAGAGKSSLVSRFLVEASLHVPDLFTIGASCSEQYGAGEPYQPFVEAFRDLVTGGRSGGTRWSRLRDLAGELAPHWLGAIPIAGDIISATMSTAVELKKLSTAAPSEEALFFQYTELFLAAAAERPILLFIDDLHWADRASVSLLAHLGRRIADKSVLIVGTYRAADVDVTKHPIREARLELQRYGVAEEMTLDPLDKGALDAFIEEELGAPPTPELAAWLTQHAGTNPLFFGELLRWSVEQGLVERRHGEFALVQRPDAVEMPRTAEATIERRLSRLDEATYRILEYASVEGTEFGSVTLAQLLDSDELVLEEALDPLVRTHRLLRALDTRELPNGELSSIYQFSHSLIHRVLHRNLQGKRRILMHRKMAQILEKVYVDRTDRIAHRLAVHFDEGRVPARAYAFAMQGATRASAVYAHLDAIELIGRALRNAEDDEQRIDAFDRLGEENRVIGRFADALDATNEAIALCATRAETVRSLALRRQVVLIDRDRGTTRPQELQSQLIRLAAEAEVLGATRERVQLLGLLAAMPGAASDQAIAFAHEALVQCQSLGDPDLTVRANYSLGRALAIGPHPLAALPHLQTAFAYYEEEDDQLRAGHCSNLMAVVHAMRGDYPAAATAFDAAARAFDAVGDPVNEANVRNNYGVVLTRTGEFDAADENFRESIRLLRRLDAIARLMHPLENAAELAEARADWASAAERWRELLACARETGYWTSEAIARSGLGRALLELGDVEGARAQSAAAHALLPEDDEATEARVACTHLAALLARREGDPARALALLEAAEAGLTDRDRYDWARLRLLRAECLVAADPATARRLAEEARATFEAMGAVPMVARADTFLEGTRS
jgi:tetratricopeptide (TPR) repeat protein